MSDHQLAGVPAGDAIKILADLAAELLGSGAVDAEGENLDGVLDVPVQVTIAGVLGPADAVTTMDDTGVATIWVGDDMNPFRQLRALLDQIAAGSLVSGWSR